MKTFGDWLEYYFWLTLVVMPFIFVLIGLFGRKRMQEPKTRRCSACGNDLHGKVSFPALSYHSCLNAKCLSAILVAKYEELGYDEIQRVTKRIHQLRCDMVADKFRFGSWPERRKPTPVENDPKWRSLVEGEASLQPVYNSEVDDEEITRCC